MGKIIAGQLGLEPKGHRVGRDHLGQPRALPAERHRRLRHRLVLDHRRASSGRRPGRTVLPHGQQLLVAADSDIKGPEDLKGQDVCSVTGSTPIKTIEEKYDVNPKGFDTYSECVEQLKNGSVDAVTTTARSLLGYAAQDPDALKVVGEPFSEERYGIGYSKDSPELCTFLNDTLTKAFEDGAWEDAFDATLGKSGNEVSEARSSTPAPEHPPHDPLTRA